MYIAFAWIRTLSLYGSIISFFLSRKVFALFLIIYLITLFVSIFFTDISNYDSYIGRFLGFIGGDIIYPFAQSVLVIMSIFNGEIDGLAWIGAITKIIISTALIILLYFAINTVI